MASAMGRFRTTVRNNAIGGTPGGIIFCSCAATAGWWGGSSAPIRGVTLSVTMKKEATLRKTKRQSVHPGTPVRGSTTGRPLIAALDLLGRRWSLRILWELKDGPLGARSLRDRCDGMSPSVLYDRLGQLGVPGLG